MYGSVIDSDVIRIAERLQALRVANVVAGAPVLERSTVSGYGCSAASLRAARASARSRNGPATSSVSPARYTVVTRPEQRERNQQDEERS